MKIYWGLIYVSILENVPAVFEQEHLLNHMCGGLEGV